MTRRSRALLCLLVACGVLTGACASESTVAESAPPVTAADVEPVVFVALGGDETVNRELEDPLRDSWTRRLFVGALPRSSVYVNLARGGATVREALAQQVPEALELAPTLATVWLGAGDARAGTSIASFERDLTELVEQLQAAGARVVLLQGDAPTSGDDGLRGAVVAVGAAAAVPVVAVPYEDRLTAAGQQQIADAIAAAI